MLIRKKILKQKIRILAIADTHGTIKHTSDILDTLRTIEYDVCFLLGDIYQHDLDILKGSLDLSKTYGVIGNHDKLHFLKDNGICDIHGKAITVKGTTFAGWGGSLKYKETIELGFDGPCNGDSSIEFAEKLPKADVLISHDRPIADHKNSSHSGLEGIAWYMKKNSVPLNVHGHLHENDVRKITRKSKSIGVFRIAVINEKGNVNVLH